MSIKQNFFARNLQVKIQWMRKRDDFAVKTRADPALEADRLLRERRELKKRRKLKISSLL